MKKLLIVLFAATAFAQSKPELTPEQKMPLENAQLKLKLSYFNLQQAQSEFQLKLVAFNEACEKLVKQTHQPEGTKCNPDTLEFIAPKPEAKK